MAAPLVMATLAQAVEHVLATVEGGIVLGLPLGIGKPNPFVNLLYRRMKAMGGEAKPRRLKIITALSLEKPEGSSELEQHFLAPLVERVFKDYPDLDYVKDLRAGVLPAHIEVSEFFFKTGDYLGNERAQQAYISTNYTFVARDMGVLGVNVIAQAVAARETADGGIEFSLSSNPDVTFELAERQAANGQPLLKVGVVNRELPFMPGQAIAPPGFFDVVVTDAAATHTLFAPPNAKVSTADYAIGLHAASLVADGGTLQIGIGALGDAIAQALLVRERANADYRRIMADLCSAGRDGLEGRELGGFTQGLYGCSEMFVNGFLQLLQAGILRREVFDDEAVQRLVNEGRIPGLAVSPDTLAVLLETGRIPPVLESEDLAFLRKLGVLTAGVSLRADGDLDVQGRRISNRLDRGEVRTALRDAGALGQRLAGGVVLHGGFFLGPTDFYEGLRRMAPEMLAQIDMTRIDFINQLHGRSALKQAQRRQGRFMNTTMMVTLLGAAVSDGLESGQVVSGVGGQYNFVAMAHALPDARSILMLRASYEHKDGLRSTLVWDYGHTTIPRHLRDVVITEYGVADLRAQPDGEVAKRLIAIADSRFQDELVAQAKAAGKLDAAYQVPARHRQNLPEMLHARLQPWRQSGLLPDFPFGTDLSEGEIEMVTALRKMQQATRHPVELVAMVLKSLASTREAPPAYLERLGLDDATSFKKMFLRKLFAGNL